MRIFSFRGGRGGGAHNLLRNDVTAIFEIESTKIEISLQPPNETPLFFEFALAD